MEKWSRFDIALAVVACLSVLTLVVATCWAIGDIRRDVQYIRSHMVTTTTKGS